MTDNAHQTTPKGSWQEPYTIGNNLYVALAFAHAFTVLAEQDENAPCYALAAYDMADAIWDARKCASHDFPLDWDDGVNTEGMADWVGLLNTLNLYGEYDTQMTGAVDFFEKAYNKEDPSYFAGMRCSIYPSGGTNSGFGNSTPADTTFWSAMANAALSGTKYSENMIKAMRNMFWLVNVDSEL